MSIEKRKDFHISYANVLDGFETAIVKDEKCYILKGDWRKELKGKNFEECIEIFNNNPKAHSFWTNTYKK